jgi:PAS domain S-box-containing protein
MQSIFQSKIGGNSSTTRRMGIDEAPPRGEGEWRPNTTFPVAAAAATIRPEPGAAERRLKLIIESVPVGLFLTKPSGETLAMNHAALSLLGVARLDEALGRDVRQIVRDEDSEAFGAFITRVCSGTTGSLAHSVTGPAGDRALETHGVSMQRSDGDAPVFLGAICDVTQQVAAQAALREMESRLAQIESEHEGLRDALSEAQREAARERACANQLRAEQDAWRAALSECVRESKDTSERLERLLANSPAPLATQPADAAQSAASTDLDTAAGSSWQF